MTIKNFFIETTLKNIFAFFKNMNLLDWGLAVFFTALVAFATQNLFPPRGWMLGIPIGLALLFIAKKRRDALTGSNQNPDNHNR